MHIQLMLEKIYRNARSVIHFETLNIVALILPNTCNIFVIKCNFDVYLNNAVQNFITGEMVKLSFSRCLNFNVA